MITIKEIQEKEFSMVAKGYNPQQVDEFLDYFVVEIEKLIDENNLLKSQKENVKAVDADSEKIKIALQNALLSAQLTAEDIKEKAQMEARKIIEESNNKVAMLEQNIMQERNRLDDEVKKLKAVKEEIGYKIRALLNSYIKMLDSMDFESEKTEVPVEKVNDLSEEKVETVTNEESYDNSDNKKIQIPEEKVSTPVTPKKKNRINIAPDDLVNKFFGPESTV